MTSADQITVKAEVTVKMTSVSVLPVTLTGTIVSVNRDRGIFKIRCIDGLGQPRVWQRTLAKVASVTATTRQGDVS